MSKDRIIKYCNKVIEISLYVVAFYIPISKAFIESFISLAIVSWLIKKCVAKTKPKDIFYPNFLNLPILSYLLVCLVSAIFSSNRGISFSHLIFKTIEYLLLFFITVEIVDRRILKNVLVVIVFSVGLVGIDGIYQYFTKVDFLRHRSIALPERPERIHGPFMIPTDFANYIMTLLPIVASLSFLKFKKVWVKPVLIIISLILFACLVLSVSKSGWIAFILSIPLLILLGNRRLALLSLLLIVIVLSLLPILSGTAQSRILHFFDFNEGAAIPHRQFLWNMGLNMYLERPFLGQGLGTFMYNFERFKPKDYPRGWEISYAHNCFLQIASETGIFGFLAFILIITVLFFISFKTLIKIRRDPFRYYILSSFLVSIFAYLVSSFFDTNLYSLPLAVLFWFMVGLTVAMTKIIRLESG